MPAQTVPKQIARGNITVDVRMCAATFSDISGMAVEYVTFPATCIACAALPMTSQPVAAKLS